MKVVIGGGSGLVGRALARSLVDDGHAVTVLSRRTDRRPRGLPDAVTIVGWDEHGVDELAAALDGADAVVNLAGARVAPWPWTRRRKATILGSRRDAVRSLVDAIAALPADRRPSALVVVSGIDAYPETVEVGGVDAEPPGTTEAVPTGPGFLADVTRALEAEAERAEGLGVRVARLRMGHVLARDADLVTLLALPVRLFLGGRMGSGRQWLSWVHIDDAVGLFRLAIADDRVSGPLNVVAPNPVRQLQFVRAMARTLRRPSRFPAPAWLVRAVLGEEASLLLGSRRIAPTRALELGYAFRYETLDRAMPTII